MQVKVDKLVRTFDDNGVLLKLDFILSIADGQKELDTVYSLNVPEVASVIKDGKALLPIIQRESKILLAKYNANFMPSIKPISANQTELDSYLISINDKTDVSVSKREDI